MINSKDTKDLIPELQEKAKLLIDLCDAKGIVIRITSTYRDFEAQNELYAQGRTKPGKKITNAKAGQSYHNFRRAFDIVIIKNGKADWNDLETYKKVGAIGKGIGLEWGGDFKTIKDYPHFQMSGGKSLAELYKQV